MKKLITITLATTIIAGLFSFDSRADNSIYGKNRTETSIKASDYVDSKTLVLVNGYNFADALSSYNIVSSQNAKLVLVDDNTDLSKFIKDKSIEKVYLIGGENTLKGKSVQDSYKLVKNVKRIAGNNRYETNRKTLTEAGYTQVGVADGRNYPDALSSSGLLKKENLGLMLVDGSKNYKTDKVIKYTFGGKNSVIQSEGKRLFGKNRYETSRAINRELRIAKNMVLTSGENFADALSSLNLINKYGGAVIVLTEGTLKDEDMFTVDNYIENNTDMPEIFVIGGTLQTKLNKNKLQDKMGIEDKKNNEIKKENNVDLDFDEDDEITKELWDEFERKTDEAKYYGDLTNLELEKANLYVGIDLEEAKKHNEISKIYSKKMNSALWDAYNIGLRLGIELPKPLNKF